MIALELMIFYVMCNLGRFVRVPSPNAWIAQVGIEASLAVQQPIFLADDTHMTT